MDAPDRLHIPARLLNPRYDDRYFDVIDAMEEARQIHIIGARLIERLKAMPDGGRRMTIGETGFGAGRLLVALMYALETNGVAGAEIDYCSVELYPLTVCKMESLLEDFEGRAGRHIRKLVDAYSGIDTAAPGWHRADVAGGFGTVSLRLYIGEALSMVESLDKPCDAWFLDGHSPDKNPDMWRAELMRAVGGMTKAGGTVTTFTVAGHVRRSLEAAGFSVEKVPGYSVKREVLLGIMRES